MEQNFAKLFRQSAFAAYNSKLPNVARLTPNSKNYGFKKDLRLKEFPEIVSVKKVDGIYGPVVQDITFQAKSEEFLRTLLLKVGTEKISAYDLFGHSAKPRSNLLAGTYYPSSSQQVQVIGRLLNRINGANRRDGYAVGVCGIVCRLPPDEIPYTVMFSINDVLAKKAYKFYVESIRITAFGKPDIILTMKEKKI